MMKIKSVLLVALMLVSVHVGRAYQLSKSWNFEWEIGAGALWMDYEKYRTAMLLRIFFITAQSALQTSTRRTTFAS